MWFKKYPCSCEWGRPYMYAIMMRSDWTKQLSVAVTRRHGCARVFGVCHFPWVLILHHYRSTICLPQPQLDEGKGGSRPWNCWARQIKSVDGFVLFRLRGGYRPPPPPTRFMPSAVAIMPPPPPRDRKNLPTALPTWIKENLQRPSSLTIRKS